MKVLKEFIKSFFAKHNVILQYFSKDKADIFLLIRKIRKEKDFELSYSEAYMVYECVSNTMKLEGDIAEVGVWKGRSAKLISEVKGNRSLHLFDTFEGLPEVDHNLDTNFSKGEYSSSLENVKKYLSNYSNVFFHKGMFPATAKAVTDKKFSLVHMDVDLFQSTFDALEFFYPRMVRGGVIISHDYPDQEGVKKAIDQFYKNKPETIIKMIGSQCIIVSQGTH